MSFQIGDIVTPVSNLTISGGEVQTIGIAGTVKNRYFAGVDDINVEYYDYLVVLSEAPTLSGVAISNELTFTEEELGGTVTISGAYDVNEINQLHSDTLASMSNITSHMTATVTQTKTNSSFYTSLVNLQQAVQSDYTELSSKPSLDGSMTEGDLNRVAKELESYSTRLGINATILQEVSDNLYGIYTIVDDVKSSLNSQSLQTIDQQDALLKDRAQDSATYFNSVVVTENKYERDEDLTVEALELRESLLLEQD